MPRAGAAQLLARGTLTAAENEACVIKPSPMPAPPRPKIISRGRCMQGWGRWVAAFGRARWTPARCPMPRMAMAADAKMGGCPTTEAGELTDHRPT